MKGWLRRIRGALGVVAELPMCGAEDGSPQTRTRSAPRAESTWPTNPMRSRDSAIHTPFSSKEQHCGVRRNRPGPTLAPSGEVRDDSRASAQQVPRDERAQVHPQPEDRVGYDTLQSSGPRMPGS